MKQKVTDINIQYITGDKLKIKNSCKKELIEKYKTSKGMSGMNSVDVNKTFIFDYYEDSNIAVIMDGSQIVSFNRTRFEKVI